MNKVYIAMEVLSAVIILILIYANIYETVERTKERNVFTNLLIANEIVVVADAVSWMHLGWDERPVILGMLVSTTYIVPSIMKLIFTQYLYEHISSKAGISKKPYSFMKIYSAVECFAVLLLCISGKLFSIQDGKYYPENLEGIYFLINMTSILILVGIIVYNSSKTKFHDTLAELSFCIVPFISLAVTLTTELNISITLMSVSMLVMYVMLESESENFLYGRANLDELTRLFNRAAYEDEVVQLEKASEENLVFASIDVNGLKVLNDSHGHTAGDELICGAAECLKKTFRKCGKVFRTGGDEFITIFYADEEKLNTLKSELEETVKEWKGTIVESLTMSVGYASRKEFPNDTIVELAKTADKRMYEDKTRYYARMGVDRRGQNDAYMVLCALYTKILKINISDDSFSIISMDISEQKKEKGFANSISEWLVGFGKSGQVHPDDLEDYLLKTDIENMRSYFQQGKTSLIITYRRKYDDGFKQVMMEIIPTSGYTDENQSLYLYVKNIDV